MIARLRLDDFSKVSISVTARLHGELGNKQVSTFGTQTEKCGRRRFSQLKQTAIIYRYMEVEALKRSEGVNKVSRCNW
jgi:hypothetical protein